MCLAISKPARAIIPVEHLEAGYEGNPHGCGFCYPEGGKVVVVKGLLKFDDFLKQYKEKEHLPMLVHFRVSTHGKPNFLNCHPFSMLSEKYALIHNGMIPIAQSYPELSDTGNFSKLVMEPMLKAGIDMAKPSFVYLVQQAIGSHNKVCVMDWTGRVVIYNETSGEVEEAIDKDDKPVMIKDKAGVEYQAEVWYSHGGYKFFKKRHTTKHRDEYEGYFNCGTGNQSISADELAAGFTGTPAGEVNPKFVNRAKLDTPPSVIAGFKAGVKDASQSAEAIVSAHGGFVKHDGQGGQLVHIQLPKKDTAISEITSGPIFDARSELEIFHLQTKMNLTRAEAIASLGLRLEDCLSYV
jgi:hypothetical protein